MGAGESTGPDRLGHQWAKAPPGTGHRAVCMRCGWGSDGLSAKTVCRGHDKPKRGLISHEYDPMVELADQPVRVPYVLRGE